MWHDYSNALVVYGIAICNEWRERGYNDTCLDKINAHYNDKESLVMPKWLGNDKLHLSHKSMLVQKDTLFYGALWSDVPRDLDYIWPE